MTDPNRDRWWMRLFARVGGFVQFSADRSYFSAVSISITEMRNEF